MRLNSELMHDARAMARAGLLKINRAARVGSRFIFRSGRNHLQADLMCQLIYKPGLTPEFGKHIGPLTLYSESTLKDKAADP